MADTYPSIVTRAATGALKFDVHVKDSEGMVIRFEGVAAQGTAMGRIPATGMTGYFKLTKGEGDGAAFKPAFTEVGGWISKAADLVPAEKYNYRPAESVRTFAQQVAHIADRNNYYCARAAGRSAQWPDATKKGALDKATPGPKLKASLDARNAAYERGSGGGMPRGNIVTYLRMPGLMPPSN